jgi:hypothetical protein
MKVYGLQSRKGFAVKVSGLIDRKIKTPASVEERWG